MTLEQAADWGLRVLLAAGGIGGIAALFMVSTQKRKLVADTGKTDAEADLITQEAQAKKTDREGRILDMSDRLLTQMQERLEGAEDKVDRLTEYVEILVQALRKAGQPVPPMPANMADDAHAGIATRNKGGTQ